LVFISRSSRDGDEFGAWTVPDANANTWVAGTKYRLVTPGINISPSTSNYSLSALS
jgi:hypothetical protein